MPRFTSPPAFLLGWVSFYLKLTIQKEHEGIYKQYPYSFDFLLVLSLPQTFAIACNFRLMQSKLLETMSSSFVSSSSCVCEAGTVSQISDCQPEGPGFNPRPGRGLNFGRPSFATPSVDRDVKPLV